MAHIHRVVRFWGFSVILMGLFSTSGFGAETALHDRIDQHIAKQAKDKPISGLASDSEFLRRVYLDLAGRIPSISETRAFLADTNPGKRTKLVDSLLQSPEYATRMTSLFHVMLMERLGDHADWSKYLLAAFQNNKPWNVMVREILKADAEDANAKGASFFLAKRLENYGQNPVDYPALTRDVGRLFLGKNLQCAQCHDHLFIKDYKQQDFQGLFAFFQNVALQDAKTMAVNEKPTTTKVAFMSVFKKVPKETGPALPGKKEIVPPLLKKGEEYTKAPDPKTKLGGKLKFSTLATVAEQLPTAENPDFSRNIANRLWFVLMGRGIVHPLDLHHSENPPSHPELLDLLAKELAAHQFDMKWLLREIALSQTYQRSSVLPKGVEKITPELFTTALEKRLSADQLMHSMLEATAEKAQVLASRTPALIGTAKDPLELIQNRFVKAFANPSREPEDEIAPSLKAALFVLNDSTVLEWLNPKAGNLAERLGKLPIPQVAEELYLSVFSRMPSEAEKQLVQQILDKHSQDRPKAISSLIWAALASTEFSLNH